MKKLPLDGEQALYSLKCFLAAMLAYFIALRIGLPRPYWAMLTSYIIANPLAGAVQSKAMFRLAGTLLGGAAAVLFVPTFVNEPFVLTAVLGLWLGFCLFMGLLDRTPRGYAFLLAGYTACIIGFPSVTDPGAIFTIAAARVQEITLGIVCASLVHAFVLPRSVSEQFLARVDAVLVDARLWTDRALAPFDDRIIDREQRRLASDVADLHQMSIHLPFDTARISPRIRTVRALLDQLTMLLPLITTIEDRLTALRASPEGCPVAIETLIEKLRAGSQEDADHDTRHIAAEAFLAELDRMQVQVGDEVMAWPQMLRLSLLARLSDLVILQRDLADLADMLNSRGPRAKVASLVSNLRRAGRRPLHRDHGLAVRSGIGAFVAVFVGSLFWIATAWDAGAFAVLNAGVCCALFGTADEPGPLITTFLIGNAIGIVVALPFAFAIMPMVTDFVTLAAVLAPPLLIGGCIMAMPRRSLLGQGTVIGLLGTAGFNAAYAPDFATVTNNALALLVGTGFAVFSTRVFQTVGTDRAVSRLLRATWRDVARRAMGEAPRTMPWMARMLDRIALLIPKLGPLPGEHGRGPLIGVLMDVRIGFVSGELAALAKPTLAAEGAPVQRLLHRIGEHYRTLDVKAPDAPEQALLDELDEALAGFATRGGEALSRQAIILLVSLRRNLFPSAPVPGHAA